MVGWFGCWWIVGGYGRSSANCSAQEETSQHQTNENKDCELSDEMERQAAERKRKTFLWSWLASVKWNQSTPHQRAQSEAASQQINLSFFFGGRRSEASQRMKKKVNLAEGVGWVCFLVVGYRRLAAIMLRKKRKPAKPNNQPKRSQISRNNERMNCWGLWGGAHLRGTTPFQSIFIDFHSGSLALFN